MEGVEEGISGTKVDRADIKLNVDEPEGAQSRIRYLFIVLTGATEEEKMM